VVCKRLLLRTAISDNGVPRGLMLGPIQVLIFIDDLESDLGLVNHDFKFVDDIKLLGKVK